MTVCVRKAWLVLGTSTLLLEDPTKGYFCTNLDLGYPTVRDVVSNKPDQDGIDDRTQYFGPRTVTAEISAEAGAGAQIDAVATSFAPYMIPSARPILHYILDRPGAPERTITLRAANLSWPIQGPYERNIQLQFVASDPAAIDPVEQSATAWAGATAGAGRQYNLTFNRIYPVGGGSATIATIRTLGDLPIRPKLRVYGPINGANINIGGGGTTPIIVQFLGSYQIPAGQYIDISTAERTAYINGDHTQSAIAYINWGQSLWGVLVPQIQYYLSVSGTSTTGITQVQATWHDRYIG